MGNEALSLLLSLFGIVFVLFLCYVVSKYVAKKMNTFSNSQNIQILEKVPFTQDKGLAIARICGKYYLIGFSNQNIEILQEISETDLQKSSTTFGGAADSFLEIFQQVRKNGWSVKSFDKDRDTVEAEREKRRDKEENQ